MAYFSNASRILAKPFVFTDAFTPSELLGRERELSELRRCIDPIQEGRRPLHVWLHGPSGSGKTTLVRLLLDDFSATRSLGWALVNCWEEGTSYLVLDKLCRDLRLLHAEQQSTSLKMDRLNRHFGTHPFVVVLDEVDMMAPRERASILYLLSGLGKIGIVAIAYSLKGLASLDARVRSRLSARVIEARPYSKNEIVEILQRRAEAGLLPGTWEPALLDRVARQCGRDARLAIHSLGKAAHNAERSGATKVSDAHLDAIRPDIDSLEAIRAIRYLNVHHRMLHDIVAQAGEIRSADLRAAYVQSCAERKLGPVASRTFLEYMNKLLRLRLLEDEYIIDRGKHRVFRPRGSRDGAGAAADG